MVRPTRMFAPVPSGMMVLVVEKLRFRWSPARSAPLVAGDEGAVVLTSELATRC